MTGPIVPAEEPTRGATLVSGRVVIPGDVPPFTDGTVHVYLQDTSFADAPAIAVAETTVAHVRHAPARPDADTTVTFAVVAREDTPINPRADYTVRVWLDRDGDGHTGPGDLHSVESHRVLTGGFAATATILLHPRGGTGASRRA